MSNVTNNTSSFGSRRKLTQGKLSPQMVLLTVAAALLIGTLTLGYGAAAAGVERTERKPATSDTVAGRYGDSPAAIRTFRTSAIGFFTSTLGTLNFIPGQTYVITSGNSRHSNVTWVYANFNGLVVSAADLRAWIECGYSPLLRTQEEWARWCPRYSSETGLTGPTEYWRGWPDPFEPVDPHIGYTDYRLQWGEGKQGWWLYGTTGSIRSTCGDLASAVAAMSGNDYELPLFDMQTNSGNGSRFHLRDLPTFVIRNSAVECNRRDPITGELYHQWHVEGMFKAKY